MRNAKPTAPIEELRKALEYDPETGLLRWRARPERAKEWNTRRAGKPAGYFDGIRYVVRYEDRLYLSSRVIWAIVYGSWPPAEIDHHNGDPADNRLRNLRACTRAQNTANRKKQSNNTSGHVGVRFRPHHGRWEARINREGRTLWRRYFDSPQEAAAARRLALVEIHGEFAFTNRSGG